MKNNQHIIDCLRVKNPVRDLILVEKRIPCAYAVPLGTEYSADILSLTGHQIWWMIRLFTNILSLTGLSMKPLPPTPLSIREGAKPRKDSMKSRSDGTLLTVDFNLRTRDATHSPQSPAGTALWRGDFVSSLRDFGVRKFSMLRWLKPPVNKVLSLRDLPSSSIRELSRNKGLILRNENQITYQRCQ